MCTLRQFIQCIVCLPRFYHCFKTTFSHFLVSVQNTYNIFNVSFLLFFCKCYFLLNDFYWILILIMEFANQHITQFHCLFFKPCSYTCLCFTDTINVWLQPSAQVSVIHAIHTVLQALCTPFKLSLTCYKTICSRHTFS